MKELAPKVKARMRRRRHARRARRRIRASRNLNRILRLTLAPWITSRYRVEAENVQVVRRIRPPYLILPNHTSVWDPFMVNKFVPGVIHYVVSDANFRSKIVEFGLGLVGSIPKTKVMSDLDTVKNIMKVKDSGGIVGIFPEGQNTWDGHTMPMYYSTAKLAKLLRVPVITAKIAGAYLSKPRWSKKRRRGRVTIRYDLAFTPEQLRSASVEEIDARIVAMLDHDEFDHNRIHRNTYVGPDRAEYAEIALFACPQCNRFDTLRSEGNVLRCTQCGYAVRFDLYGFFQPVSGALRFDSMRSWNLWQTEELRRRLIVFVANPASPPLFTEELVKVEIGYKSMPLEHFLTGRVELYPDRIEMTPREGEPASFPIKEVIGINVQNNERLEFYAGDDLYRLTILDPRGCTYKWDLAVRFMQELAASTAAV
jgi:1-acyl-sn-glycerol-3-phosphate acyltransferase